jgi:formate dehydrogenase major subunit
MDYYNCKLAALAARYELKPLRLTGEKHKYAEPVNNHPYIKRDPAKCILCGLCVRVCGEAAGIEALGLAGRGFDTQVLPALNLPLAESGCNDCGLCVHACPTGAIVAKLPLKKQVPLAARTCAALCEKGLFRLGEDGLYHLQTK